MCIPTTTSLKSKTFESHQAQLLESSTSTEISTLPLLLVHIATSLNEIKLQN